VGIRKQVGETLTYGGRQPSKSFWKQQVIAVPRCTNCETYHGAHGGGGAFLSGLGCLTPVVGSFVIIESAGLGLFLNILIPIAGVIVGIGLAVLVHLAMNRATLGAAGEVTKDEGEMMEFPAVKEMEEQGWVAHKLRDGVL